MSDFINTIEALGDEVVFKQLIERKISEFSDDVITSLPTYALREATYLKSVNFPNVTSVGAYAFYSCPNLETVKIPKCTSLGNYMFAQCSKLTSLTATKVSVVGEYAFQNCTALTSIDLPAAYSIGYYAFYGCTALTSVNLPNAQSLGGASFNGCKNIQTLDFPILSVINGSEFSGCTNLSTLILRRTAGIITGKANMLNNTKIASGTGYIYVPSALLSKYKSASYWSSYSKQFRALEDWTVDGTVTGALDAENRVEVTFYNDDRTLLGTKTVTKGGTASYDGTTPVCSLDASREFDCFEPQPTNVTSNMITFAQYKPTLFGTLSWSEISEICETGNAAEQFSIGDEKKFTTDNGATTYVARIVAINHDDKADGSGKAGITIAIMRPNRVAYYTSKIAYSNANSQFWYTGYGTKRDQIRDGIYTPNCSELKNVVKTVNKSTRYNNAGSYSTGTQTETFFIPSISDLSDTDLASDNVWYENCNHYPGFETAALRKLYDSTGAGFVWWTRSTNQSTTYAVGTGGTTSAYTSKTSNAGLCICCCI